MPSVSHRGHVSGFAISPAAASGLVNVKDQGALGDGATNDTNAIQAAYEYARDNGMDVYWPTGRYVLSRDGNAEYALRFDSSFNNITTYGAGRGTILQLDDASFSSADLELMLFEDGVEGMSFFDLVFDGGFPLGTSTTGVGEQTHIMKLGGATLGRGGCTDISFNRCWFQNVRGDGAKIVGSSAATPDAGAVYRPSFVNCNFDSCHRAGLVFQKNVFDLRVQGCYFKNTNDQDIDWEPSGTGANANGMIQGNIFDHRRRSGMKAATLTGNGNTQPAYRIIFKDNLFIEGTFYGLNVSGAVISGNVIYNPNALDSTEAFYLFRTTSDLIITDNWIQNGGGSTTVTSPSAALKVAYDNVSGSPVQPSQVIIRGNIVNQYLDSSGIDVNSGNYIIVHGNIVTYAGTSVAGTYNAISTATSGAATAGLNIMGNIVRASNGGTWLHGITFGAAGSMADRVIIVANDVTGFRTSGIRENYTRVAAEARPVILGNIASTVTVATGNGAAIVIGGNSDAPILRGTATPEGNTTAPVGSMYLRVNGGANTTLYIKESGSGSSGWVAK